jgi:hypothetical protein
LIFISVDENGKKESYRKGNGRKVKGARRIAIDVYIEEQCLALQAVWI